MEKNVRIIDKDGNVIGFTYPKRAKGLVKKGRAEPVNENCIMITDTQVPAVVDSINTEVHNMSKVIGFEARGFQIDPTCKGNNVANRMFVTDALGNNVEVYEIGSYGSDWTQISYEMPVEKNEDFEFLFAMTGDIDANNSPSVQSNFIIMPIHEKPKVLLEDLRNGEESHSAASKAEDDDPGKNDWDNRYQYSLLHRDYRPTMEKVWNGSSIRFYRIPFNTGDADKIRFVFVAFQRPYKIFPVKNFEEYSKLPDFNSEGNNNWFGNGPKPNFGGNQSRGKNGTNWNWNWNRGNNGPGNGPSGWYSGPKDFKDAEKFLSNIGNIVNNAVKEAMENFDRFQKGNFGKRNNSGDNVTRDGKRKIFPEMLTLILEKLDEDDEILDLANCDIESGKDFVPGNGDDGGTVDDLTFSLDNSSMDGDAFYRIMSKVGDCCKVNANNCVLGTSGHGPELAGGFGERSDDTAFHFVNSQISEAAFISILSKIGDCCTVDFSNADIKDFEELRDLSGFCHETFDDTEIRVDNTTISQRFYQALVRACGSESKIVGRAVIV
ncbi:MAG: hypothetical protein K6E47_15810 [Lachnospiraceae bacterium]|nr:hypothetical protein [Lachnospiraceae bacterium]